MVRKLKWRGGFVCVQGLNGATVVLLASGELYSLSGEPVFHWCSLTLRHCIQYVVCSQYVVHCTYEILQFEVVKTLCKVSVASPVC